MREVSTINIENAEIGFRNFAGEEQMYNNKGDRNFCVFFDEEMGEQLKEDGWNIKWLKPREDEEDLPRKAYLQVAVAFGGYPPNIVMISSGGKTLLKEDSVDVLDWAEIENVDVIIRPYHWTTPTGSGIKAYLKSMYVTIFEDEFAKKYAHLDTRN